MEPFLAGQYAAVGSVSIYGVWHFELKDGHEEKLQPIPWFAVQVGSKPVLEELSDSKLWLQRDSNY